MSDTVTNPRPNAATHRKSYSSLLVLILLVLPVAYLAINPEAVTPSGFVLFSFRQVVGCLIATLFAAGFLTISFNKFREHGLRILAPALLTVLVFGFVGATVLGIL